eukprot:gnl/Chilomastix_cuspidata/2872.p2 GENE.gnl/Chilomastix_cuspidata/2872~~gnl/Chilomastix_cuspidata/2872.p2  ORF type:complete len:564 (-),score=234.94 gnl/Chilomastix_cuspidata/2872:432-2087(-)
MSAPASVPSSTAEHESSHSTECSEDIYFKVRNKIGIRKFADPSSPKFSRSLHISKILLFFLIFFVNSTYGIGQLIVRIRLMMLGKGVVPWGLSMTIYVLGQTLAALPVGRLSDLYGRVRPILLLTLLHGLCGIAFCFSNALWSITVTRFLSGVTSASLPAFLAYLNDITPTAQKPMIMSLASLVSSLSSLVGLLLTAALISHMPVDYLLALTFAIVCVLFGVAGPFFIVEPAPRFSISYISAHLMELVRLDAPTPAQRAQCEALRGELEQARRERAAKMHENGRYLQIIASLNRRFPSVSNMTAFAVFQAYTFMSTLVIFMNHINENYQLQNTSMFMIAMLAGIVGSFAANALIVPPLLIRAGPRATLVVGTVLLLVAVTLFGYVFINFHVGGAVSFALISIANGMCNGALGSVFSLWGTPDEYGVLMSIKQVGADLGRWVAPIVSALAYTRSYKISFLLSLLAGAVALCLCFTYKQPPAAMDRLLAAQTKPKKQRKKCSCLRADKNSKYFQTIDTARNVMFPQVAKYLEAHNIDLESAQLSTSEPGASEQ